MATILVIDDDRTVLRLFEKAVRDTDAELLTATNAEDGLALVRTRRPELLLLDISLPDASGIELVSQVRALAPKLPIAFITVSDDCDTAISAMRSGAFDYLVKPLSIESVHQLVRRALETQRLSIASFSVDGANGNRHPKDKDDDCIMLGHSPAMLEVYKEIGRIAPQDVAVLINGESGTGKELVARAIYRHSSRYGKPFLSVNCAAITDTLLESELFGHEKGSFTGADRRRIGKFEECYGGTIFLDEVGDMSLNAQSKVLRLIEEQQFQRVGGNTTIATDVRIISATNRDLREMIADGRFRADLYHRLHGYRIDLPPLRDRGGDMELLVAHLLTKYGSELDRDLQGVSQEGMQMLGQYPWPGNIRELQTVLRTAALKTPGPVIVPDVLHAALNAGCSVGAASPTESDGVSLCDFVDRRERAGSNDLHAETLEMVEQYLIARVLRESKGNQSKAAKRLGITRGTLRSKIRTLGINGSEVPQTTG